MAFPTETVYGLGADATDAEGGAEHLCRQGPPSLQSADLARGRPGGGAGAGRVQRAALKLARAFWPGPLTLVVPAVVGLHDLAISPARGSTASGLRVPSHPLAQASCWRRSGGRSRRRRRTVRGGSARPMPQHVLGDLDGRIDAVLDGGRGAGRRRIDHRGLSRRDRSPPPSGRRSAGGDRRGDRARSRRSSSRARRSDRPRHAGVSLRTACASAIERRGCSARRGGAPVRRALPCRSRQRGRRVRSQRERRPAGGRRPVVFRIAGARRIACRNDRRVADPREGLGEAINDRLRRAAADR